MLNYIKGIWASRYFWLHLVGADLRSRWQRSAVGIFWCMLQPLGMTCLLTLVFSRIFHADMLTYAPYILSGFIVWDYISSTLINGTLAFVQADSYIKQCKQPLAIYTLRLVLGNMVTLMLASLVLIAWVLLVSRQPIHVSCLAVLTFFPCIALMLWPFATILAYFATRFRDLPHLMGLILQSIWFISPVYFEAHIFRDNHIGFLVDNNPIYHILEIIRAPLLLGQWPHIIDYAFCIGIAMVGMCCMIWTAWRMESKTIFYL